MLQRLTCLDPGGARARWCHVAQPVSGTLPPGVASIALRACPMWMGVVNPAPVRTHDFLWAR